MVTTTILGIPFFSGNLREAIAAAKSGGLVVAPSGPGLAVDLAQDPAYAEALIRAEVTLPDSGFMILLWKLRGIFTGGLAPERISGLKFLQALLREPMLRHAGASFWIMPSLPECERNLGWLSKQGFHHLSQEDTYIAPDYRNQNRGAHGVLEDEALAALLEERRPQWIIVNVGSGVQEPLGHWLRSRLCYTPTIVCTGAAIAFLSGGQANIPNWADRLYLGWLFRIVSSPEVYLPRYLRAARLAATLLRYGKSAPPQQTVRPATASGTCSSSDV